MRARPRQWLAAAIVVAGVASLSWVVLDAGSARATTGEGGLAEPPAQYRVGADIGNAVSGRFYMSTVPRSARIIAARLDVAWDENYGSINILEGEILIRSYGSNGSPTDTIFDLYLWKSSESTRNDGLTAAVISPDSVTEKPPLGAQLGRLTFVLPKGSGSKASLKELPQLKGKLTLDGHGTYAVEFRREKDTPEQSRIMKPAKPPGKQSGKKSGKK
jgi:hypothetical protein